MCSSSEIKVSGSVGVAPVCEHTYAAIWVAIWLILLSGSLDNSPIVIAAVKESPAPTVSITETSIPGQNEILFLSIIMLPLAPLVRAISFSL